MRSGTIIVGSGGRLRAGVVRIARVWAILAGLAAALADQSGRAMTIQDLLLAIRVTDPQLSPIVRIEALPRSPEPP